MSQEKYTDMDVHQATISVAVARWISHRFAMVTHHRRNALKGAIKQE